MTSPTKSPKKGSNDAVGKSGSSAVPRKNKGKEVIPVAEATVDAASDLDSDDDSFYLNDSDIDSASSSESDQDSESEVSEHSDQDQDPDQEDAALAAKRKSPEASTSGAAQPVEDNDEVLGLFQEAEEYGHGADELFHAGLRSGKAKRKFRSEAEPLGSSSKSAKNQ
ncbi:hypothetical protein HDV03_004526 [Kappamyces sp. JEL0829]|nr:hypothetical protein HDV03_004526 [Kappamyces sp. JEL0829]